MRPRWCSAPLWRRRRRRAITADREDRDFAATVPVCVLSEGVLALAGPAIVVALCWLRSPEMLTTGRFWAEDTMFFGWAHGEPNLLGKLAYVYKGHYELFATLSHALASYVKPKLAPLVTGTTGLALEAVLAYLLVRLRADLGVRLLPALAICALLVVSPCASEHYLNVLNVQWLASAILFVLVLLPERRLARHLLVVTATAAFVLGLTGPASCVLLPVALLYAVARRSRHHAALVGGLFAACLIQGLLLVTHPVGNRFQPTSPYVYVIAPLLQVAVKHLMGLDAENNLAEWFRNGPMAANAFSSFVLLPLGIVAWIARRIVRHGLSEETLLLLSFAIVTMLNELGAIGDRNNMVGPFMMRYFFLPSLIIGLLAAKANPASWRPELRHAALYLALAVSTVDFFTNGYNRSLVELQHAWPRQVDQCRMQPGPCAVEVSPGGYHVELYGASP